MKTVYYNGHIYTGQLPLQSAFTVEDGRFIFAGQDCDAPEGDIRIDLQGKFVCAGFNDSHMHLLNYGHALNMAPLHENTHSLEAMISSLRTTKPGRGGWILGRGWNQDYFEDIHRMPNRYALSTVRSPGRISFESWRNWACISIPRVFSWTMTSTWLRIGWEGNLPEAATAGRL